MPTDLTSTIHGVDLASQVTINELVFCLLLEIAFLASRRTICSSVPAGTPFPFIA